VDFSQEVHMVKQKTLYDYILRVDKRQAERYARLDQAAQEIAAEGIIIHLRACNKSGLIGDEGSIREVIDGAIKGIRIYAEAENDQLFM
jgi:hypothetical protein